MKQLTEAQLRELLSEALRQGKLNMLAQFTTVNENEVRVLRDRIGLDLTQLHTTLTQFESAVDKALIQQMIDSI